MEGVILGIDPATSEGAIKAADGKRFNFSASEWKGQFPAQPNMKVDFDVSNGTAVAVYPLGKSPVTASASNPKKSKTAASLWAFFLGGLGAHKFYVGSWGWGLLYLIFCWTWIPTLLAIVELVRYITLDNDEFEEKAARLNGPFDFLW